MNKTNKQRKQAVFLDRDGVLNVEQSFICSPEDLHLYPYTLTSIKKINKAGYISCVVSNQSAVARNLCSPEDIEKIHKKLQNELQKDGAWLDGIYYCPHHPDVDPSTGNTKYIKSCGCRKPLPGLLLQAREEHNIDLDKSFMIGDSERDIEAGKNAGCKTIGLLTGHALKGAKNLPDYIFDNLLHAVDFITNRPFNQHLKQIYNEINNTKNSPFFIGVSGLYRSGKSIFINNLTEFLQSEGKKSEQIDLNLYHFYGEHTSTSTKLADKQLINALKNNDKITGAINPEIPFNREFKKTINTSNADIIIIEKNHLKEITKELDLNILMVAEETKRKIRVKTHRKWLGDKKINNDVSGKKPADKNFYDITIENNY